MSTSDVARHNGALADAIQYYRLCLTVNPNHLGAQRALKALNVGSTTSATSGADPRTRGAREQFKPAPSRRIERHKPGASTDDCLQLLTARIDDILNTL
jgi:hypothetical protein